MLPTRQGILVEFHSLDQCSGKNRDGLRILFCQVRRGDNGEQRVFDMTPYLDKGIFTELRDPAVFNSVRPAFDTVEWANGADIAPEVLYRDGKPVDSGAVLTHIAS